MATERSPRNGPYHERSGNETETHALKLYSVVVQRLMHRGLGLRRGIGRRGTKGHVEVFLAGAFAGPDPTRDAVAFAANGSATAVIRLRWFFLVIVFENRTLAGIHWSIRH